LDISLKIEPELEVHESSRLLKTTLHFEMSSDDSYLFNRVARQARGHVISRVQTKEEVYKSLLVAKPFQIVINCGSSRSEGFQLLEDLREINQLDDLAVVVLSDCEDESTVRLAFALGATRYFQKPITLDDYKECIMAILTESRDLDGALGRFEKFPSSVKSVIPNKPNRPSRPRQTWSLITEKHALSRYPWVYHSV
jgi:DNA-binding NarL/FixJ family response regulator